MSNNANSTNAIAYLGLIRLGQLNVITSAGLQKMGIMGTGESRHIIFDQTKWDCTTCTSETVIKTFLISPLFIMQIGQIVQQIGANAQYIGQNIG